MSINRGPATLRTPVQPLRGIRKVCADDVENFTGVLSRDKGKEDADACGALAFVSEDRAHICW